MKGLAEVELRCAQHTYPDLECATCAWLRQKEERMAWLKQERKKVFHEVEKRLTDRSVLIVAVK